MFRVTIVGFDQAYASAITGALDVFALAGVTWQRMQGSQPQQQFHVQIATPGGKPVECINHLTLNAHVALEDVTHTDLLILPTIGGVVERVLEQQREILPHIVRHYAQGADIASNCSGAFFLAEAGILSGKQATTHWGYADLFALKYPDVKLQVNNMITEDERIFCAGGGMAWFDLTLLLIQRYCGHDIAKNTAKAHVIDLSRGGQQAYASVKRRKYHQDGAIIPAQDYIESNYASPIQIESLAKDVNMTPRTFARRFKSATGETALNYIQRTRVDSAKSLLETSELSLEQITQQVGYDDISSFTRLFKRQTGLSPKQYRMKFSFDKS